MNVNAEDLVRLALQGCDGTAKGVAKALKPFGLSSKEVKGLVDRMLAERRLMVIPSNDQDGPWLSVR